MPLVSDKKPKRPFLILLLCLVYAGLVVFGWIRVQQAVQNWSLEATLLGQFFPFYSVVSGAAWGLAGALAVAGLWMRLGWGMPAAWAAAIFYPLTFWLEKVLVLQSPTKLTNWPFEAGVTIAWLLFVALTLHLKSSREFLKG
jgi:hypothetical protein